MNAISHNSRIELQRETRRFFRVLVFLLCCLPIISCGGSTTPSSASTMTLKVAQNSNAAGFFPLYIAQQEHFFSSQGVTLDPPTPSQLGTGPKMTAALEGGNVDVAAGIITDAFTLSRVDTSVRLIGTLSTSFGADIVVSKGFTQQMHLSANSFLGEKVKALVGKKIGVTSIGSATDAFVKYLFKTNGLDQNTATLVNMGGSYPQAALSALRAGRVDAISFPVPTPQEAEIQNIGDILISPDRGDVPSLQGQLTAVLYTRAQTLTAKPKAVQAFIRAIAQAEDYMQKNPNQAKILLRQYLKLDQKTIDAIYAATQSGFPPDPQVTPQSYEIAHQFHVQAGLIANTAAYKDIVATDTIRQALNTSSRSS